MAEIYRDSTGKAVVLAVSGVTGVSAKLLRNGLVVSTPTPVVVSGKYAVQIPYAITSSDGEFVVEWTYTLEGSQYVKSEEHYIVTPLVDNPADTELERIVRSVIENFTGNYFGYYAGTYSILGSDDRNLELPRRLTELESVTTTDALWESPLFVITGDGWFLQKKSSFDMSIKDAPPEEYLSTVGSDGVIYSPYSYGFSLFRDNVPYLVTGKWGYSTVPEDVMRAAKLLYEDYSCADAGYRNKYLRSIRAGNWRLEFRDDAFAGTGNLTVDNILIKYKINNWVVA